MTNPSHEPLDLDPIKARLAAATPGPWAAHHIDDDESIVAAAGRVKFVCGLGDRLEKEDAELIAHAPTDLSAMVKEVIRLRVENEDLGRWLACEMTGNLTSNTETDPL
jgi:hypothetical protein